MQNKKEEKASAKKAIPTTDQKKDVPVEKAIPTTDPKKESALQQAQQALKVASDAEIKADANTEMRAKIEKALDRLRINLQYDGGDIQLVEITPDKVVKVHFLGACGCCPNAQMTLKFYIEKEIRAQLPDIKEVVMV